MKRIKWKNVSYLLMLLVSLSVLLHDFYRLALEPFFTGKLTGLTWFGVITLVISFIALDKSFEQLKSAWIRCTQN